MTPPFTRRFSSVDIKILCAACTEDFYIDSDALFRQEIAQQIHADGLAVLGTDAATSQHQLFAVSLQHQGGDHGGR